MKVPNSIQIELNTSYLVIVLLKKAFFKSLNQHSIAYMLALSGCGVNGLRWRKCKSVVNPCLLTLGVDLEKNGHEDTRQKTFLGFQLRSLF